MDCKYKEVRQLKNGKTRYRCQRCGHERESKYLANKLFRQCDRSGGVSKEMPPSIFPSSPPPRRKTTRTPDESLIIITSHCLSCPHHWESTAKAPDDNERHKCRKIPSCQCLWTKLRSKLWGCPLENFTRDEELYREMTGFKRSE